MDRMDRMDCTVVMGFKRTVQAKMKMMPLFTRPRVIQTHIVDFYFLYSKAEKKRKKKRDKIMT